MGGRNPVVMGEFWAWVGRRVRDEEGESGMAGSGSWLGSSMVLFPSEAMSSNLVRGE